MPPKRLVTREMILNEAYALTGKQGFETITVRGLAEALRCSTQPIYHCFEDMHQLELAVMERAVAAMMEFISSHMDASLPPELSFVTEYVRFAGQEKHLFALLFANADQALVPALAGNSPMSFSLDFLLYANGLIMMNAFGALHEPWEDSRRRLYRAYESLVLGEREE